MNRTVLLISVFAVMIGATSSFAYTGSLSSNVNNGIKGTGAGWWPITFSWNVTQNSAGYWNYEYTFQSTQKQISHLIIETSPAFKSSDIIAQSLKVSKGSVGGIEVGRFDSSNPSNPSMPGYIYGIKFDSTSGVTLKFSFDSWRKPVWGDFYAKDGKTNGVDNTAWNAGLTANDTDPTDPASDGSIGFHILRPDTEESNNVPEPSSLAGIAAMAIASISLMRKRIG